MRWRAPYPTIMETKKSYPGPSSKADEGLNRAYGLCDRLLTEIRAAQAILSKHRERQPEPIGAILERIFKQINERGKEETLCESKD